MKNAFLLGVTLGLTLLFMVAGANHLMDLKGSVNFLATSFPFSYFPYVVNLLVILVASSIELFAPLIILYSLYTNSKRALAKKALCLLLFFVLSTLIFIHNPVIYPSEFHSFMKNLAMLSGLILLYQKI